jgi:hypothetical protein
VQLKLPMVRRKRFGALLGRKSEQYDREV